LGVFDGGSNNNSIIFPTNYVISKLYLPAGLSDYTYPLFTCLICHILSGAGKPL